VSRLKGRDRNKDVVVDEARFPTVGGEYCSRCGRLSGGDGVEGGGEVVAEVGDEVEDEINVGVG
jgi:hypothetical protein